MIRLLDDVIWVKPEDPPEKLGRFYVPDEAKPTTDWEHTRTFRGFVVAAGPGKRSGNGNRLPMGVKVGDWVQVDHIRVEFLDWRGDHILVTREPEILGICHENGV